MYNPENTTAITFQINIAAQKIISQVMATNEEMKIGLENGIKKAIEEFDFEKHTKDAVTQCIQDAIKHSASWGNIRDLARTKADKIVDDYISKEMENFKLDIENGTKHLNDIKDKKL